MNPVSGLNNYFEKTAITVRPIVFILIFSAFGWAIAQAEAPLPAAPLDKGYALAPRDSASPEEKALAYLNARCEVLSAAMKYEKTPYRYGGLTRKGLDCSGFIYVSFKDALGVSLPRTTTALYSWVEKIPDEKMQPGDLLFFKTNNTGRISHAGIYLGNGWFIHSASAGLQTGVILSSLGERYWSSTYAGAGRAFPQVITGFQPAP